MKMLMFGKIVKGVMITMNKGKNFYFVEVQGDGVYSCRGAIKTKEELRRIFDEEVKYYSEV